MKRVSPSLPKTGSGERRRKNRNGPEIPTFEPLTLAMLDESDSVLVKLLSMWKRELCRLMNQMLSLLSSFQHFLTSCESDTKSHSCETFTCALRVMCYCVISASANTSGGPLRLKQNGVVTCVITSGRTDCTLRTQPTLVKGMPQMWQGGTEKHRLYHCPSWQRIRNEMLDELRKWEQIAKVSH